jgi:hypothetical protein
MISLQTNEITSDLCGVQLVRFLSPFAHYWSLNQLHFFSTIQSFKASALHGVESWRLLWSLVCEKNSLHEAQQLSGEARGLQV